MELQKSKNLKEAVALLNYYVARGAQRNKLEACIKVINKFVATRAFGKEKSFKNSMLEVYYEAEKLEQKIVELIHIKDMLLTDKRYGRISLFYALLHLRNRISVLFTELNFNLGADMDKKVDVYKKPYQVKFDEWKSKRPNWSDKEIKHFIEQ